MLLYPRLNARMNLSDNLMETGGSSFTAIRPGDFYIDFPVTELSTVSAAKADFHLYGSFPENSSFRLIGRCDPSPRATAQRNPPTRRNPSMHVMEEIELNAGASKYVIPFRDMEWLRQVESVQLHGKMGGGDSVSVKSLSIDFGFDGSIAPVKRIHVLDDGCHPKNGFWRKGELLAADRVLLNPPDVERGDVLIVRPFAEHVDDRRLDNIKRETDRYRRSGCRVVNDPVFFENHNLKNETFRIWDAAGVPHPSSRPYIDRFEIEKAAVDAGSVLLRLNNQYGGKDMFQIDAGTGSSAVLDIVGKLERRKDELIGLGFGGTDLMMVEKIQPDGDGKLVLATSHVVDGRVIASHCSSDKARPDTVQPRRGGIEEFTAACLEVESATDAHHDAIVGAVECLGIQTGSVDWFLIDGKPLFLEVNATWGMGYGRIHWPVDAGLIDFFREKARSDPWSYRWTLNRFDEFKFWMEFYKSV